MPPPPPVSESFLSHAYTCSSPPIKESSLFPHASAFPPPPNIPPPSSLLPPFYLPAIQALGLNSPFAAAAAAAELNLSLAAAAAAAAAASVPDTKPQSAVVSQLALSPPTTLAQQLQVVTACNTGTTCGQSPVDSSHRVPRVDSTADTPAEDQG